MDDEKLDIQIQTSGVEKSTQDLEKLTKALGKVSSQVEKLSTRLTKSLSALTRFANAANKISDSFGKVKSNKTSNITKTVKQTQELGGILKSRERYTQFLIPNENLSATHTQINSISNATKKAEKNTSKWLKTLWQIGKVAIMAKTVARTLSSLVRESGSWIENLNLFAVTFGNNYQQTLDWALEFSERLGVANNEIVKMTGLFKQLSTSIGISDELGDSLSQTLTQLTYDFASFYNITDIESAAEKLQAGIFSGQIRTLRSLGIDVSQESIDNMLKTNEALNQFNLSARQLSQSQKVIARVILTMEAGKNAFGDMSRSIDTLENRIRVLKGSWSNLKLAIGDLFSDTASNMTAYASGVIQAITSVIRAISPIKKELEYDVPENVFTEISEDAENASDSVNQLSFDKFEALTSNETENLEITKLLTEELQRQQEEYDKIAQEATRVDEMVQSVKKSILAWVFPNKTIEQIQEMVSGLGEGATLSDKFKAIMAEFNPIIRSVLDTGRNLWKLIKDIAPTLSKVGKAVLDIVSVIVDVLDKLKLLYPVIMAIIVLNLTNKLKGLFGLSSSMTKFFSGMQGGLENMRNRMTAIKYLADTKAYDTSSRALTGLRREFTKTIQVSGTTVRVLDGMKIVTTALSAAIAGVMAFSYADSFFSQFSKEGKVIAGVLGVVTAALIGVAAAAAAAVGYLSWGTALVAIGAAVGVAVAGIKATVEGAKEMKGYENGGIPEKSELFYMNEHGVPEALINTGGSKTNVINIDQLSEGMRRGFVQAIYDTGLDKNGNVTIKLDGSVKDSAFARAIFPALKTESTRRGGNQL